MDAPVLLSFVAIHESGRDMAVAPCVTGGYVVPALNLSVFTDLVFQSRGLHQPAINGSVLHKCHVPSDLESWRSQKDATSVGQGAGQIVFLISS